MDGTAGPGGDGCRIRGPGLGYRGRRAGGHLRRAPLHGDGRPRPDGRRAARPRPAQGGRQGRRRGHPPALARHPGGIARERRRAGGPHRRGHPPDHAPARAHPPAPRAVVRGPVGRSRDAPTRWSSSDRGARRGGPRSPCSRSGRWPSSASSSAGGVGLWYLGKINPPGDAGAARSFTVEETDTLQTVSERLQQQGLVADAGVFRWYVEHHDGLELTPGYYQIRPDDHMGNVMLALQHPAERDLPAGDVPRGLHGRQDGRRG